MNERERWLVRHVPELQIISEALWDRVKRRQKTLKRDTRPDAGEKPFWGRQRPRHLITGLGKCGECGSRYVKINANILGCADDRIRATCSTRLIFRLVN